MKISIGGIAVGVASVLVVACGGASSGSKASSGADSTNAEQVRAVNEAEFVKGCRLQTPSAGYCECGFEQFWNLFGNSVVAQEEIAETDPRFGTLLQQTASVCGALLDEGQIQAGFIEGCVEGDERTRPYCECSWASLRSRISKQGFLGEPQNNPEFMAALNLLPQDCAGTYSAEAAREDFVKGCTESGGGTEARCGCLWTEVVKVYSVEQVVINQVDIASVPGIEKCR